jgi:hypothetical protein
MWQYNNFGEGTKDKKKQFIKNKRTQARFDYEHSMLQITEEQTMATILIEPNQSHLDPMVYETHQNHLDTIVIEPNQNQLDPRSIEPNQNHLDPMVFEIHQNHLDTIVIEPNQNQLDPMVFEIHQNHLDTIVIEPNQNQLDPRSIEPNQNHLDPMVFEIHQNHLDTIVIEPNQSHLDPMVYEIHQNHLDTIVIEPNQNNLDTIIIEPHQNQLDLNTIDVEQVDEGSDAEYLNYEDASSESNFSLSSSESENDGLNAYYDRVDPFEKEIYKNSGIKFKHFVSIFVKFFGDRHIPNKTLDKILKFIRVILPSEGINVPKTYKSLLKTFQLNKTIKKKICGICSKGLMEKETCLESECLKIKNFRENRGKKDPSLIEFNIKSELQHTLEKNWASIMSYKTVLNSNSVTDLCNSRLYKSTALTLNSISLVLFIDGAPFNKSENGSVWAIVGLIANMPPLMRSAFKNMITIAFINGKIFDFNGIYDNHLNKFKQILNTGLEIEINHKKIRVTVSVLAIIADNPGRSKTCYCQQHNGFFGCFHCLSNCYSQFGKKYLFM